MKTIFINTGLDSYVSEKIRKGRIHDNIPAHLPRRKVTVKSLYRELEKGRCFLDGFSLPRQQEEELKKALSVVAKAAEAAERKKKEVIITEEDPLQALEILTELAKEEKE